MTARVGKIYDNNKISNAQGRKFKMLVSSAIQQLVGGPWGKGYGIPPRKRMTEEFPS
jgi:hypothetical protein